MMSEREKPRTDEVWFIGSDIRREVLARREDYDAVDAGVLPSVVPPGIAAHDRGQRASMRPERDARDQRHRGNELASAHIVH